MACWCRLVWARDVSVLSLQLTRSSVLLRTWVGFAFCSTIGMQEYAEKQKVEELRQKAEAAKRKAQNRRLWQAQQFLMPWEVTQHSK